MVHDRFALETKAIKAFTKWMEDGRTCRALFEQAHMALPEPLKRFLGETEREDTSAPRVVIPPLQAPPRPAEAEANWIWVPVIGMTPTGLVLGVLRRAPAPIPVRKIIDEIARLGAKPNEGSIQNIGTRLSNQHVITRSDDGWKLIQSDNAPVIYKGHAWGLHERFEKYEIAVYRRLCLLHVLRVHADGMQNMQLLKAIETCDWVNLPPLSKDVIKLDLESLQKEGEIKRIGNTGKWIITAGKSREVEM